MAPFEDCCCCCDHGGGARCARGGAGSRPRPRPGGQGGRGEEEEDAWMWVWVWLLRHRGRHISLGVAVLGWCGMCVGRGCVDAGVGARVDGPMMWPILWARRNGRPQLEGRPRPPLFVVFFLRLCLTPPNDAYVLFHLPFATFVSTGSTPAPPRLHPSTIASNDPPPPNDHAAPHGTPLFGRHICL